MAIHFDMDRMAEVKKNHMLWWEGALSRPLVKVTLTNAFPSKKKSAAPVLTQRTCADFSWSAEALIDALDEELGTQEYLGDAFPYINFDFFGPGVLSALCDQARLDNSSGQVWFFPNEKKDIEDIHVSYDRDNPWARRIKSLYKAGCERWNGLVMMGMPDLGGVMDVASVLCGSDDLLEYLIEEPEEVERLCREIQEAWYAAYWDFSAVLAPQKGYTDWAGLLSTEPSYVIQSDFTIMVSNDMYRQFAYETIVEDTRRLKNTIYHLDGVGALRHLDSLLEMEDLNAIQFVYGAGQPSAKHWLDVYKKIRDHGKQYQVVGTPEDFLDVLGQLHGTPYTKHVMDASERELAAKIVSAR